MSERLICIGISCYNRQDKISKALEHVYAVDWPKRNLKIVLIDDGSTDDTGKIMNQFAEKHRPEYFGIKVFHKKVRHTGILRNMIVDEALKDGCWAVWYIDSDVYVPKDSLHRLTKMLESGAGIAHMPYKPPNWPRTIFDRILTMQKRDLLRETNECGMGNTLVLAELFNRIKFREEPRFHMIEDGTFARDALALGYKLLLDEREPHAIHDHISRFWYGKAIWIKGKHWWDEIVRIRRKGTIARWMLYNGLILFIVLSLFSWSIVPFLAVYIPIATYHICKSRGLGRLICPLFFPIAGMVYAISIDKEAIKHFTKKIGGLVK